MTRIAIFASGAGSNAARIIDFFRGHQSINICLIACNRPGAGVVDIATRENIPVLMLEKDRFFRGDGYVSELAANEINFIVLAGFLWKIPASIISSFPNSILNIHPALLPDYGGKGMYGPNVHQAVINAGETESGITIHWVDEHYDNGDIIFQAKCKIEPGSTPEKLAAQIHELEYTHFPVQIEKVITAGIKSGKHATA